jgi:hypothetical protein
VTRISKIGKSLAVTSNHCTLLHLLVTANVVPTLLIRVTLMMEGINCSEKSVLKRTLWHHIQEDFQLKTETESWMMSRIVVVMLMYHRHITLGPMEGPREHGYDYRFSLSCCGIS